MQNLTRMALGRAHTSERIPSASAAAVAKMLLLNQHNLHCGVSFGSHLTVTLTPNVT